MNIGMLVRGEYMKAVRRFAVVAFTVALFLVLLIMIVPDVLAARRNPSLPVISFPGIWEQLTENAGHMAMFFLCIVVILMTASEFMWRTARQNVIDGLSKQEWFAAKLLAFLMFAGFYCAMIIVTYSAFAAVHPFTSFMRAVDAKMLAGWMLGLLGFGAIAFFLGMVVRKDGGALGLLLVWSGMGEPLVAILLEKLHKGWGQAGRYFPFRVFGTVSDRVNWNPEMLQRVAIATARAHRAPPQQPNMLLFSVIAAAYIILFIGWAYADFMRRDL